MMCRRTYGTIAAMLAFLAVMLTAELACGPAAPGGQDGAGGAGATAIPSNTNAPEPTPSPTPPVTPDLTKLGVNTEVVIAFLSVPTPDAALTDAAAPAIPPITLPPLITISISTMDLEATRSFLDANGGVITETGQWPGTPNWNIFAEMPPALLPALSQQPEIVHAFVYQIYEKVDDYISELIVEDAIAQRNNPTWPPGSGGIKVVVEATPEGYANVRRFLGRYSVPLTHPDFGDLGSFDGTQIIPPNLVVPVANLPGVTFVNRPPIEVPLILPQSGYSGQETQIPQGAAPAGQSAGAAGDVPATPALTPSFVPTIRLPAALDKSPLLRGLVVQHHKSAQGGVGAAPLTKQLEWVEVRIASAETDSASVRRFLTDRGIEYYLDPLERPGVAHREQIIGSHLLIALLQEVAELPSVQEVTFWDISPFPKIGPRLALLLLEHEVGIPHQPQYGDSCGYDRLDPYDALGRHYEILPARIDDHWNRVGDDVLMQFNIAGDNRAERAANAAFVMRHLLDIGVTAADVWDRPDDDSLTAFTKWAQFYEYEYLWLWLPVDIIYDFSRLSEVGWVGSPVSIRPDYYRCMGLQEIRELSSSRDATAIAAGKGPGTGPRQGQSPMPARLASGG